MSKKFTIKLKGKVLGHIVVEDLKVLFYFENEKVGYPFYTCDKGAIEFIEAGILEFDEMIEE